MDLGTGRARRLASDDGGDDAAIIAWLHPHVRGGGTQRSGIPEALALFLFAYFGVWTAFALLAFAGDMQLHRLVDAWAWLGAHSQYVLAGTLGFAAVYQLTPLKDACLKACRHPGMYLARHYQRGAANGLRIGLGHALFCLGCCWALMLVMFAAGVAHLAWMGVLGAGDARGERLPATAIASWCQSDSRSERSPLSPHSPRTRYQDCSGPDEQRTSAEDLTIKSTPRQRVGITPAREDAEKAFLDAAERLLVSVGYAGITTRKLAEEAGLNHGLVHYYFGSMQELLLAGARALTPTGSSPAKKRCMLAPGPFIEKWRTAMRYLDEDEGSGYAKIWFELQAMGWNDPEMRKRVVNVDRAWTQGHHRGARQSDGRNTASIAASFRSTPS